MVGGDRNLFVRKGGASQKILGNTDLNTVVKIENFLDMVSTNMK